MAESSYQRFRYHQIAQELKHRITRGRYPTGRLPAERTLGDEFGVQRDTVRRALAVLMESGVLMRDSTRGTYISPQHLATTTRESEAPWSGVAGSGGGVLLVVRTFEDTTAPSAVFRGLSQRLGEAGIPAYWYDPGDKATAHLGFGSDRQLPPPDLLVERGIQGLVIWPQTPASLPELRELRPLLPLVMIDRRVPGFEADFVGFHDFDGGRTVTEHLLRLGHRRIGFVSGEPQATAVQSRLAGYAAALDSAGVERDASRVLHQEGGSRLLVPAVVDAFLRGNNRGADPLTAIVCSNDIVAARLIHFIRSLGRRVPEDVAVTGFGDLLPSMMDAFGITTVAQPFDALGRAAGELLLDRLSGANTAATLSATVRETELPMRLIVRESCGSALTLRTAKE